MARSYLVGFAVVTPHGAPEALKAIRQAVGKAVKMTASPQNVKPVVMSATTAGFLDTQGLVLVSGYQYYGNNGGEPDKNQLDTLATMAKASLLAGRAENERCLIEVAYCLADSHKDGHIAMMCGARQQTLKLPKAEVVSTGEPNMPFMHKLLLAGLQQASAELLMEVFPQARAEQLDNVLSGEATTHPPRQRF